MPLEYKSGCVVCGAQLEYLEGYEQLVCYFCGQPYDSNSRCTNGHFVCDKCHSMSANDLIEQFCVNSDSEDPLAMAITLMKKPQIKMHGPEHHYLVPAVLLAAYYNIVKNPVKKEENIREARKRTKHILGGFCGSHGDCGAAVGTGIFVSLITGATPLSEQEFRLSNLMTAQSLTTIANLGGPRCCKRNTYLAIIEAVKFLQEHFEVEMKLDENLKCEFTHLNEECKKDECPFFDAD